MLTSYWVRCPHSGCHWFGSLIPRQDAETKRDPSAKSVVLFDCPKCRNTWKARIVGDSVRTLPPAEVALKV